MEPLDQKAIKAIRKAEKEANSWIEQLRTKAALVCKKKQLEPFCSKRAIEELKDLVTPTEKELKTRCNN